MMTTTVRMRIKLSLKWLWWLRWWWTNENTTRVNHNTMTTLAVFVIVRGEDELVSPVSSDDLWPEPTASASIFLESARPHNFSWSTRTNAADWRTSGKKLPDKRNCLFPLSSFHLVRFCCSRIVAGSIHCVQALTTVTQQQSSWMLERKRISRQPHPAHTSILLVTCIRRRRVDGNLLNRKSTWHHLFASRLWLNSQSTCIFPVVIAVDDCSKNQSQEGTGIESIGSMVLEFKMERHSKSFSTSSPPSSSLSSL